MNTSRVNAGVLAVFSIYLFVSQGNAQQPNGQHSTSVNSEPMASGAPDSGLAPAWTGEPTKHPLAAALRWAEEALPRMEQLDGYTATLIKRERIDGQLRPRESLAIKVRHKPFSIYAKFLGPRVIKGQEALYIDGANHGKMWAHGVGIRALTGAVSLDPAGPVAMQGERYPLTQIGILNLTKRLIEVVQSDIKYGECTVKLTEHAKINGRQCRCLEVVHPRPRSNFGFHIARVFIDEKLNIPIRYECYSWPKGGDDNPPLIEEYTYLDVKLNAGLTDADFNVQNPRYGFRPEVREASIKGELHDAR